MSTFTKEEELSRVVRLLVALDHALLLETSETWVKRTDVYQAHIDVIYRHLEIDYGKECVQQIWDQATSELNERP